MSCDKPRPRIVGADPHDLVAKNGLYESKVFVRNVHTKD